jgi:hypothetical protein
MEKSILDIGIGINNEMEVLIPKKSILPFEFECNLVMNETTMLSIYEGNRYYTKDNHNIGNYSIYNKGPILFKLVLQKKQDFLLKVYINDELKETIKCFNSLIALNELENKNEIEKELKQELEKETELRKLKIAKNEYREYIDTSISSIYELNLEELNSDKQFLLDKLNWAKQVLDVMDVSSDEYILALREIETIVNPILNNFTNKPII